MAHMGNIEISRIIMGPMGQDMGVGIDMADLCMGKLILFVY